MTSATLVHEIINFWFAGLDEHGQLPQSQKAKWWQKDNAFDQSIKTQFASAVEKAAAGEFDSWQATAEGSLALLILLDQFTRNIYRNDPKAFASDPKARAICHHLLEQGQDKALHPVQRVFTYLPLEHSESLDDQHHCVELFNALHDEVGEQNKQEFAYYLDYAHKHFEIIERFGRFPHRNQVLGRESTADELAYLSEPGARF